MNRIRIRRKGIYNRNALALFNPPRYSYSRRSLPVANTVTLVSQRLGTSDLLKANIRVICAAKPVESPVASGLQFLGETITC